MPVGTAEKATEKVMSPHKNKKPTIRWGYEMGMVVVGLISPSI